MNLTELQTENLKAIKAECSILAQCLKAKTDAKPLLAADTVSETNY
jgi:hypothetical protein